MRHLVGVFLKVLLFCISDTFLVFFPQSFVILCILFIYQTPCWFFLKVLLFCAFCISDIFFVFFSKFCYSVYQTPCWFFSSKFCYSVHSVYQTTFSFFFSKFCYSVYQTPCWFFFSKFCYSVHSVYHTPCWFLTQSFAILYNLYIYQTPCWFFLKILLFCISDTLLTQTKRTVSVVLLHFMHICHMFRCLCTNIYISQLLKELP